MSSSVVALFCEDIRTEQSGQHTLIGLLPDNIAVPRVPGAMPKLAIFLRAQVGTDDAIPEIVLGLKNTDDSQIPIPNWEQAIIAKAKTDAESSKSPIYGLILSAVFAPFQITKFGTVTVSATINGEIHIAGILNFIPDASASALPSSQSPSAAPQA